MQSDVDLGVVCILIDLENLRSRIQEDSKVKLNRAETLQILAAKCKDTAAIYGQEFIGQSAILFPGVANNGQSVNEKETIFVRKERNGILKDIKILVDAGFDVDIISRQSADAVDYSLCRAGNRMVSEQGVSAVVLATNDGKEPYLSFISSLVDSGIRVAVLTYGRAGKLVRAIDNVEIFDCSEYVREFSENKDGAKNGGMKTEVLLEGAGSRIRRPKAEISSKSLYKKLVKAICRGEAIGPESEKERLFVRNAVKTIENKCKSESRGSLFHFSQLVKLLKDNLITDHNSPSDKEVEAIVNALLDTSDLFKKVSSSHPYKYNERNVISFMV